MTNAEKYLKDGVDIGQLARNLGFFLENTIEFSWQDSIVDYFKQNAKPTLTEDERVILRNIKTYTHIRRTLDGELRIYCYITKKATNGHSISEYNHLFQFIENGEEYSIEELLDND